MRSDCYKADGGSGDFVSRFAWMTTTARGGSRPRRDADRRMETVGFLQVLRHYLSAEPLHPASRAGAWPWRLNDAEYLGTG